MKDGVKYILSDRAVLFPQDLTSRPYFASGLTSGHLDVPTISWPDPITILTLPAGHPECLFCRPSKRCTDLTLPDLSCSLL
jgi:hypothetical protein